MILRLEGSAYGAFVGGGAGRFCCACNCCRCLYMLCRFCSISPIVVGVPPALEEPPVEIDGVVAESDVPEAVSVFAFASVEELLSALSAVEG